MPKIQQARPKDLNETVKVAIELEDLIGQKDRGEGLSIQEDLTRQMRRTRHD